MGGPSQHSAGCVTAHPPTGTRRRDIQGLRAVAVLVVVAFHAGLPVPGGFIGVDIFFVISGYVITNMLSLEWSRNGSINFRRFYSNRFKRLTPALALMVSSTLILSALLLSPTAPLENTAKTGLGAMLLVANLVIARTTGGYFDEPAATNPLLNTWSLSLEEQFYLVFPLVLLAGWMMARRFRSARSAPIAIIFAFMLGSFGAAFLAAGGTTVQSGHGPAQNAHRFLSGEIQQAGDKIARSRILANDQRGFAAGQSCGAKQPEYVALARQAPLRIEKILRRQTTRAGKAGAPAIGQRPAVDHRLASADFLRIRKIARRRRGRRDQSQDQQSRAHPQQPPKRFAAGGAPLPAPTGAGGLSM